MARRRLEAAIRVGKEIDHQQTTENDLFKGIKTLGMASMEEKMMGVYSLQFSMEGDQLAVGCGNGSIINWSCAKKLHQGRWSRTTGAFSRIPSLQASTLLSAGSNGCISLWDLVTSREVDTVIEAHNEINGLDFCLDGGTYATAGKDLNVRLYCAETNKLLKVYEGSNSLLLDKEELSEFGHGMRIFALRFHPDENNIFVTGGWDNQLKIWDSRTASGVQRSIPGPHICGSGLDIKNGKILTASWVNQDALQLWDLGTGRLETVIPMECDDQTGEYLYCAQFCDGHTVLAGGSGTNNVQAVNFKNYKNLGSVSLSQKSVQALDSTDGGRLFAVGGIGGQVKIGSLQ
ncbi:putative guanine nucleotide-binding protein subunit beta-2-like 1 [Apostichopus japonicus]|uniref:Putative guanine nucleotide-binding protein subunit beta-2-like 1 n=1 Tax=Stichopus japonicus TaxID=307972 RepID=A0A2G8KG82_STIJA|nr:putative guanine nucleotide-binding protein subunit beta-2-like 1 [Apostichopus japonicus]